VPDEGRGALLVFRAGDKLVALPLADVVEVMRPLPISKLEGTPRFVLGAGRVRGAAVPVIDARVLLEGDAARPATRWISLRLGTRRAALAVDEVLGARTLRDAKLGALPPLLDGVTSGAAEWVASVDEQLAFVLRTARLVPEAAWDALEAARQT
jgi:purine-binding chemotaxis protein CheW